MARAKFDYPDLDVLDSPLVSPTPFTSLGGIPGSAIAENIFNDPDSWEENDIDDDADLDVLALNPFTWLVGEIEKFKANSADVSAAFEPAAHGKRRPSLTPPGGGMNLGTGLRGIDQTNNRVRPISINCFFEPDNDEDIQGQLSKILDAGGIRHHVRPLSSALSPPSSSRSGYTSMKINSSTVANPTEDDPSPFPLYSASITQSFLEWYGIYPDSDLNLSSLRQQLRKSLNPKIPASVLPSPMQAMRSSPTSPSRDKFSHPTHKRASSIPPPGLEPPSRLSRSRSPVPMSTQPRNLSEVFSASPPPYSRTQPTTQSRSPSSSNSPSQSPTATSVQGGSNSDTNGAPRRRRLPTIPPASPPCPPRRSLTAPPSTTSPAPTSQLQLSASRPISSARSPLVGPAGPRTRLNSRMSGQNSTAGVASLPRRPPMLRL